MVITWIHVANRQDLAIFTYTKIEMIVKINYLGLSFHNSCFICPTPPTPPFSLFWSIYYKINS